MSDYLDDSAQDDFSFSEREKMAMLEKWFQQRTEMTSKALKLILVPLIVVIMSALVSWWFFLIPDWNIVLLALFGAALVAWIVCLFLGGGIFKKVRIGDAIMLRKIKSSRDTDKS